MAASFDDGKDEGALRTIGELGDALGIKAHVLRYWEGQFPMLQPLKRSGGRRYYRPEDVALVQEIARLVNREGYTLRGAKAALKGFLAGGGEREADPAAIERQVFKTSSSGDAPYPATADTVAKLRAIRAQLADALAS